MPNGITNPRWEVGRRLGGGGGGDVYLCFHKHLTETATKFMLHSGGGMSLPEGVRTAIATQHLEQLYSALVLDIEGLGALKIPKLLDPRNSERLKREIAAMKAFSHPALIKLLDHDADESPKWFVMQYHPGGSLADIKAKFQGHFLEALLAIRPVVEAVAGLHQLHYVHRDIKPKNIFVDKDGALILGDLGIVFPPDEEERLTVAGDEIISRDWVPDWIRFDDAPPQRKVDVFMLAKVIYFMVTGGKKIPASQLTRPANDLTVQFPHAQGATNVFNFLKDYITTDEEVCRAEDAGEMLKGLDRLIEVLNGHYSTQLVFSFYSSHSTTNLIILTQPYPTDQYPHLVGLRIFLPQPADEFRLVARIDLPGPTRDVTLSFFINGHRSNQVRIPGQQPSIGIWNGEAVLKLDMPLPRGLHTLDVVPISDVDGGRLTALMLYAG
jgi:serine/threonine protein kinase